MSIPRAAAAHRRAMPKPNVSGNAGPARTEERGCPAARETLAEAGWIDESELAGPALLALIDQPRVDDSTSGDPVTLGNWQCVGVAPPPKAQTGSVVAQIEQARMGWASLGAQMIDRLAELAAADAEAVCAGKPCFDWSNDARYRPPALTTTRSRSSSPRAGYFGVIDERLDLALVALRSDSQPEWTAVMAGPVVNLDPGALP
jgi:hypothetical protein